MSNVRYKRTTDAETEPITAQDLKDWSRITESTEGAIVQGVIKTARLWAEVFTDRAFITQTWKIYLDTFPRCGEITLPNPPIQSVTSIEYYDSNGDLQTFSSSNYQVDIVSEPGRLVLNDDVTWPSTETGRINSVIVTYVAGWASRDEVPEDIKTAIKQLAAHLFEHRESHSDGFEVKNVPMTLTYQLWPYRMKGF